MSVNEWQCTWVAWQFVTMSDNAHECTKVRMSKNELWEWVSMSDNEPWKLDILHCHLLPPLPPIVYHSHHVSHWEILRCHHHDHCRNLWHETDILQNHTGKHNLNHKMLSHFENYVIESRYSLFWIQLSWFWGSIIISCTNWLELQLSYWPEYLPWPTKH
jgi:hypothetical protein